MPIDPSTTAAITSTIDNASSILATQNINKKTRKWNEEQYDKQRKHSLMDWEMQNAYNSPEQQMARLKAAGLNPHLVYGNGAEAMSNQAPRSTETQSWRPEAPRVSTLPGLMAGYDMQMKQAQSDNIKQLTEVAKQEQSLKAAQTYATLAGTQQTTVATDRAKFDLALQKSLQDITVHKAQADLESTKAQTVSTLSENERRQALQASSLQQAVENILTSRIGRLNTQATTTKTYQEIRNLESSLDGIKKDNLIKDFEIMLNKYNITKSDPIYARLAAMLVNKTPQQIIQQIPDAMKKGAEGAASGLVEWLKSLFTSPQ